MNIAPTRITARILRHSMLGVGCAIFTLLLSLSAALRAADASPEKPNIVLIFVDDLGYGGISPFGNKKFKTPHLEKMAAEGMKFTNFYATPVCSMSRACLLTGCYSARVSIPGVLPGSKAKIGLNPNEITLAEIVKPRGYATICIGKWHLGHREPFLPTKQVFDSYFGLPYSNDSSIDQVNAVFAKDCVFRLGLDEKKARTEAPPPHSTPLMRGTEVVEHPADQDTLTKRYTEEAVKFIRANPAKPFFLYLPHSMVHTPQAASEAFRGKSAGGLLGDTVEEIDWSVGQIMATLEELKLDEKTLVIFTSDNGGIGGTSKPLRGGKGSLYEGGNREPCIMRWPGRIPAGTTCNQIAGNIDMLPTSAKITGTVPPQDRVLDGRDITSLMFKADAPAVRDTHLYFTLLNKLGAIRQGDWKLFFLNAEKQQPNEKTAGDGTLYDLAKDPYETTDVAAAHADIVARLRAEAQKREKEIEEHRRPAGTLVPERIISVLPAISWIFPRSRPSTPLIGYRYGKSRNWRVYTNPFKPEAAVHAQAIWLGYKVSEEISQ
jgi:arylsulfatase A-like enzyme